MPFSPITNDFDFVVVVVVRASSKSNMGQIGNLNRGSGLHEIDNRHWLALCSTGECPIDKEKPALSSRQLLPCRNLHLMLL